MAAMNEGVVPLGDAINGFGDLYPRHLEGPHYRVLSLRNGDVTVHTVNVRNLTCSCGDDRWHKEEPEVCDHVAVALYQQPDLTGRSQTAMSLPERDARVEEAQDTEQDTDPETGESEPSDEPAGGLTATDTGKVMEAYEQAGAPLYHLSFTNNGHEIEIDDNWQDMDEDDKQAYRDAEDQLDFVQIDWEQNDNGDHYPARKYVSAADMDEVEEVLDA